MRLRGIAALACATVLIAGCGSSANPNQQVVRAADRTAQAPGYKMSGVGVVSGTRAGTISMALQGSFDRADQRGLLVTTLTLGGRRLAIPELLSQLTVYMSAAAIPGGTTLTGGRPYVKIDLSHTLGAISASSLPTATDPTQFIDYLRAVSSNTKQLGSGTIRGVKATHYRATVDLNRYPNLVPATRRSAVSRSIRQLDAMLRGHTMPLDVWIDGHSLVRRLGLSFTECVAQIKSSFSMTVDLYDYGRQTKPKLPAAKSVYDLTPLVTRGLKHAKLGCA